MTFDSSISYRDLLVGDDRSKKMRVEGTINFLNAQNWVSPDFCVQDSPVIVPENCPIIPLQSAAGRASQVETHSQGVRKVHEVTIVNKTTARKSTNGMAPRKELATKAERKSAPEVVICGSSAASTYGFVPPPHLLRFTHYM
jgi:hypothetical protein